MVAKTLDHLEFEKKIYSALSWGFRGNKSCQMKLSCHCHFCSPGSFLVHYSPLLTLFYLITCPRDLPFQESLWTHQLTKLVRLMFLLISCELSIKSMIPWVCFRNFPTSPEKIRQKTFKPETWNTSSSETQTPKRSTPRAWRGVAGWRRLGSSGPSNEGLMKWWQSQHSSGCFLK